MRAGREISTESGLHDALVAGRPLAGVRLQGLDLTRSEEALLARKDLAGLVVLGGVLSDRLAHHLRTHHAVIFPTDPRAPIDPYRGSLYTASELYAGLDHGYARTPDARAYAWSTDARLRGDAYVSTLRALHDDAIQDAFDEALEGWSAVGVMGGHALRRGCGEYAAAAHLGHDLAASGYVVLTGGGPGAMEAANLGAAAPDRARLDEALARLAAVPGFEDVTEWARIGLDAARSWTSSPRSVAAAAASHSAGDQSSPPTFGVPTWFYGHEPPNVFPDLIAKYFSNALREDALITRANAGIIVLPGAAGTVQEIFAAVTLRYYTDRHPAARDALGSLPPLVLVGTQHWTQDVPVRPVVDALAARNSGLARHVSLVDTPAEAIERLVRR